MEKTLRNRLLFVYFFTKVQYKRGMHTSATPFILPKERAIIIIGNYGSGKSEVAVNWTLQMRTQGVDPLSIADLDIVNPYFRCREAVDLLRQKGVNVVAPRGGRFFAELPIILPEVKGLIQNQQGTAIFDVGGEDVGAKVLNSFQGFFQKYELLIVLNASRPFTDSVDNMLKMTRKIEVASGLRITGLIGNTHLMEETTPEVILNGLGLLRRISDETGLPIRFITARAPFYDAVLEQSFGVNVLRLERLLSPPWTPGDVVSAFTSGTGYSQQ